MGEEWEPHRSGPLPHLSAVTHDVTDVVVVVFGTSCVVAYDVADVVVVVFGTCCVVAGLLPCSSSIIVCIVLEDFLKRVLIAVKKRLYQVAWKTEKSKELE
ncbi:hypothetical protein QBC37DRAFT_397143 [Rhypophila decipiens]|uniref:Transmembrane protein n=1 Tax=Rhypophila decipiens TaxID=261697 RepID=A0AAN7B8W7_9PEZI|nr:hypothetical protein QBC37DRAFT_397143 [Rhypophila decipiens]